MKTLIVTSMMCALALSMSAGEPKSEHPEKYCAKMKDGKKEIMHNGMAITKEAKLANGVTIKPDGTITKADGTTETLKEGECMDKDGMVMNEKSHDKNNKDHNKKDHDKKKDNESKY